MVLRPVKQDAMCTHGRRTTALLVAAAVGILATLGHANYARGAKPAEAPAESRAQVARALAALAPAWEGLARPRAAFAPGTLEYVISAYAPLKPWGVSEGPLPALRHGPQACPRGMALVLNRSCVDIYENIVVERDASGALVPHPPYALLVPEHVYIAVSQPNVVPQAYISQKQAEAACSEAHKRLCSAVEWRLACGGAEGFAYPYGGERAPRKCNDSGRSPMMSLHADKATTGFGMTELNDPLLNQQPDTLAKTGAFADCKNSFGLYDMVGNLHEWTADPNGTFEGGYYLDTHEHGDGCAYRTIAHGATYHDYSTGFRCCADPIAASDGTSLTGAPAPSGPPAAR